ncbi:MAG: preprotein translocase subunit SecG [Fibrobacteraceae bacterium]|jgi:preprotein translocase subunit SecG|nr:preprotein translocase subunit SecG [Fibrobacteraceae bacterium]MBQ5610407.1 preprotein translocase subunit SecG [Fibrobacteraceae bacterium]MEE1276256.1 preprotein translocase subunit SecG [Fibrobacteraceae bacterium]
MSTLFWIGIVLHVLLCLFLILLVLIQNDKMGGLAGLGGMTSQSAFSTAGAATFIQKLTKIVAIFFFILVFALGFIASRQSNEGPVSDLRQSATETSSAQDVVVPELPAAMPVAPEAPAAVPAQEPAAPAPVPAQ